jgi:Zn-dependent protease
MALAGPLTNLVIAFVSYGIFVATGGDLTSAFGKIISTSVLVNLGFFVFNILPIPPLDGSRVMYALAPDFVRQGLDVIERYGIFFVFVVVMLAGSLLDTYMTGVIQWILTVFAHIVGGA